MESYAEAVGIMERSDVGSDKTDISSHLTSIKVSMIRLLDRLLLFIKAIAEYSSGIYIGAVVGWLLGFGAGNAYIERFKPVYFSDLNELGRWEFIPYGFARSGAIIGIIAGAIVIAFINSRLLIHRVVSLYEKEVTDPKEIAISLGKSKRWIQKVINKLAKKGKIICKKTNFSERIHPRTANTY